MNEPVTTNETGPKFAPTDRDLELIFDGLAVLYDATPTGHAKLRERIKNLQKSLCPDSSFSVMLKEIGPNKISVIKEVRASVAGLGLQDAKELVERAPAMVTVCSSYVLATDIKYRIEAAGGKVEIK